MKRRDSIVFKSLSLAILAGLIVAAAMQLYTRSRMMEHFQELDEGIAVEALNRNLDVLQAEIKNLRILARTFVLIELEPELEEYRPVMESLNLNFLAISRNGPSFHDDTGYYLVDGEYGKIPDTGLFFEEVLKGPFTEQGTSEWGFLIAGAREQIYLLSTNAENESDTNVVLGRLLKPTMAYYLDRKTELSVDFKDSPADLIVSNTLELNVTRPDRPTFPRVTAGDVSFEEDGNGNLHSEIHIKAPYLNNGLLIELIRKPEIRNTGFREVRIFQNLYLAAYIIFLVLLTLWMLRVLSAPLGKLIQAIRNWDGIRLPNLDNLDKRKDEIGLLSETFLRMSGDIVTKTRSLEEQAVSDALTGLFNRRRFDESFISEWNRHKRQEMPISVIMADIDLFKKYNDRYGHPEGDVCLRRVARICSRTLKRPGDIAFRYGGEEFVFLLSGTGLEGAEKVADGIRNAVFDAGIVHEDSAANRILTLSLGVASCLPESGTGCEDRGSLLLRADNALYKAKETGRNKVIVS